MQTDKNEIAVLQLQIKQQELQFDKSMSAGEELAITKRLFHELIKMIERLDELKANSILHNTENHQ